MATQSLNVRKAADGAAVIEIERISKRFQSAEGAEVTALNEVSLSISAGRFTTLLGPSGCGKTTLLRAIAGFEDPDAGEAKAIEARTNYSMDAVIDWWKRMMMGWVEISNDQITFAHPRMDNAKATYTRNTW